jgi:hypothetical protein
LIFHGGNFASFSECALISQENYSDFDSAIPRFESWRPSQQIRENLGSCPSAIPSRVSPGYHGAQRSAHNETRRRVLEKPTMQQ